MSHIQSKAPDLAYPVQFARRDPTHRAKTSTVLSNPVSVSAPAHWASRRPGRKPPGLFVCLSVCPRSGRQTAAPISMKLGRCSLY